MYDFAKYNRKYRKQPHHKKKVWTEDELVRKDWRKKKKSRITSIELRVIGGLCVVRCGLRDRLISCIVGRLRL
jgi:hypothetical protein